MMRFETSFFSVKRNGNYLLRVVNIEWFLALVRRIFFMMPRVASDIAGPVFDHFN